MSEEFTDHIRKRIGAFVIATRFNTRAAKISLANKSITIPDLFYQLCLKDWPKNKKPSSDQIAKFIKSNDVGKLIEFEFDKLLYKDKSWNFDAIFSYLAELENERILYIGTPRDLVNEILDKIPEDYLIEKFLETGKLNILDPACGRGRFLFAMKQRLVDLGFTEEEAIGSLYGIDIDPKSAFLTAALIDPKGLCEGTNIHCADTLNKYPKELKDMKFDVIVGNPPFDDSENESSFSKLWVIFALRAFDQIGDDDYIAMITPTSWFENRRIAGRKTDAQQLQEKISSNGIYVNASSKITEAFSGIGTKFCYFIARGKKSDGVVMETDEMSIKYNPPDLIRPCDAKSLLVNKILSLHPFFERLPGATPVGNLIHDRDREGENVEKYKYKVQFCNGTIKWSDTPHKYQNILKIIFPAQTSKNFPIFDEGVAAPSMRGACYAVKSKAEGENFISYMKSKLMQFVITSQRVHHGFLSISTVSSIPQIDLSRRWTNQEIYAYFNLTKEEIELIEETVKG